MEYGCVGLSTERAMNQFGSENVEIYHAFYHPLELTIPPERESQLLDYYLKAPYNLSLICSSLYIEGLICRLYVFEI